jgi:RNA polymerase sigma-70 factor, ECF subfamily
VEALARRAARGDREAFALVCGAIEQDVWRYCNAVLRDPQEADDATQETFVRIVTAIRRYRGDAPVRVWACVIARRVCSERIRRAGAIAQPVDPARHEPRPAAGPSASVEAQALLDHLDADTRTAFVLTQLVGFTYQEAADIVEVPVGTIRSRVHRARSELAALWADRATDRRSPRAVPKDPSRREGFR